MVRSNFRRLLANKMAQENRRITYKEVSEETGVPVKTISAWDHNQVSQFHNDVIENFCNYFKCQVGDLLELVEGVRPKKGEGA